MSLAVARSSVLRVAAVASCLLVAAAGTAFAADCLITGPTTVEVGEAVMLCSNDLGAEAEYFWSAGAGDIGFEQCLNFPDGFDTPGCRTYDLYARDAAGVEYKCSHTVCVVEIPKEEGRCWLTGGGQRITDADGNIHSYGGNINPGCSETAGDGGNWNDVNHTEETHFQGQSIRVIRCGNVGSDIHPDGSESPVTPVNFIEFEGVGRFKERGGQWMPVFFHGLYEDREEPGSAGQPDVDYRDRYFLNVYTDESDPAGTSVLLVDGDGNPGTIETTPVTHGNLQMHFKPCDNRDVEVASLRSFTEREPVAASSLSLSAGPNPTSIGSTIRFALPTNGDVSIRIYDIAGRELADLGTGPMSAGQHSTMWNLTDRSGNRVARGIYFARMTFENQVRTQHIVVSN